MGLIRMDPSLPQVRSVGYVAAEPRSTGRSKLSGLVVVESKYQRQQSRINHRKRSTDNVNAVWTYLFQAVITGPVTRNTFVDLRETPAWNYRSAQHKENAPHSYKPQLTLKQNVVVTDRINHALIIQDKYRNTALNLS